MKRVSQIFLKIGSILGFVAFGVILLLGIIYIAIGASVDFINESIENGSMESNLEPEVLQFLFLVLGGVFITLSVFELIGALITKNRKNDQESIGKMVRCIVWGAISGNQAILAGGIVGVIYAKKYENDNNKPINS